MLRPAIALSAPLCSLLLAGCLTAPTASTTAGAAAPEAAAPAAAAAAAPGDAPATPAKAGAGLAQKLVVWDGDKFGKSAKGWQECNQKPDCKVSLGVAPSGGKSGAGLKFHAEGGDWMGFGWNWFGWWPETGGTDISGAKVLSFQIKVESKAWDPKALTVGIRCSKGKKESEFVNIAEFVEKLDDGQWHEVTIPLDRFLAGKGAAFDTKTAWELGIGTWSQTPQNLDVYLDDVGFQ